MTTVAEQEPGWGAPDAEDRDERRSVAASSARSGSGRRLAIAVALFLVTVIAFLPVLNNGFVSWDDQKNFLRNYGYRSLRPENLRWAWTTYLLGVYQPLAWIILEAQYVAWGLNPRGYLLTSLLLHALNAVVLWRLTVALLDRVDRGSGSGTAPEVLAAVPPASALAAALFAVHPLRVEVVAWASCQPYLPCALFAMLAVLTYLRACDSERRSSRSRWLAATWLLYLAALLCKAAAVPLPVVLLILDFYPLRRVQGKAGRRSLLGPGSIGREKLPFFALMLAFSGLAILAKERSDMLHRSVQMSLSSRLAQAVYSISFYAIKTVAPFRLTAYYPLPRDLSLGCGPTLMSLLAVVVVSMAAYRVRRRWPGLPAAWACYLVCLGPNLGLIRISLQFAADRYCYLASMAGVVVLACLLSRLALRPGRWRLAMVAAGGLIVGLSALSWRQCLTWRTSEALWTQALEQGGRDSSVINYNLGVMKLEAGRLDEARRYFLRALQLDPRNSVACANLGSLAYDRRELGEAESRYRQALALNPDSDSAMVGLGMLSVERGRLEDAERWYRKALRVNPENDLAHMNLGVLLNQQGEGARALVHFAQAVRIWPEDVESQSNLACALTDQGRHEEARAHFAEALRLDPGYAHAHAGLGLVLSRLGRFDEASAEYEAALRIKPDLLAARQALDALRARRGGRDVSR